MKKTYLQVAKTTTEYKREVVFDSEDTGLWYGLDGDAENMSLRWSDLDLHRQEAILSSFKLSLKMLDDDLKDDPNLDRGWDRWSAKVEVIEY